MPQQVANPRTNTSKLIAMVIFLLIDLGLNSILDYDLFNNQTASNNASHLLLGLLGFQAVVEISAFLILFIAMADTFLFRVGLLGLLIRKFRVVLLLHPVYIAITIASGALRVRHLSQIGNNLNTLYRYNSYVGLSLLQKVGEQSLTSMEVFTWVQSFRRKLQKCDDEKNDKYENNDKCPLVCMWPFTFSCHPILLAESTSDN